MSDWLALGQSRSDPLLDFYWTIQFQTPAGPLPPELVESCQIPLPKYDADFIVTQARRGYFAKFEEFGVASFTFYMGVDGQTVNWLTSWQSLIKDSSGNYNVPASYMGSIVISTTDPKNSVMKTYTCKQAFPASVTPLSLGSQGQRVTLEAEFAFSQVLIE